MIIREAPTEEERRRIRRLKALDYTCMAVSALIIILTVLALIYGKGGLRMLEAVMLLGGLLNAGLAVRAGLAGVRIAAAGALILALLCIGVSAYLVLF